MYDIGNCVINKTVLKLPISISGSVLMGGTRYVRPRNSERQCAFMVPCPDCTLRNVWQTELRMTGKWVRFTDHVTLTHEPIGI